MCNHYASTLGINPTVHAFASKTERDEWINANWARRSQTDADDARGRAIADGLCVCHAGAKPPKSWGIWLRDTPYDDGSLYWMWR